VGAKSFAAATGLNIASRQIGGAFGVAVLAVMLDGHTQSDGADPFLLVYWMMAAVCVGAALAGLRLALPSAPPRRAPRPIPTPADAKGF
jgi:hypothetical protein